MKAVLLALALACAVPAAARASQDPPAPPAPPSYGAPVDLETARALVDRALEYGAARGWRIAVAVVEPSGELVAFARMDDVQYGSIHVAQRKAATAARYRTPTLAMEERTLAGRTVILANEDTLPIAGGRPIVVDGRIVGAIGVSGVTSAQDDEVAQAALAPLAAD